MNNCSHKWLVLDRQIATKPHPEVHGHVEYVGDKFLFYCEYCLEIQSRVVRDDNITDYAIIFEPFRSKKEPKKGTLKIDLKDFLEAVKILKQF